MHLLQFFICPCAGAFQVLQVLKHSSTLPFSKYARHWNSGRLLVTSSDWLPSAPFELSVHEVSQRSFIAWRCVVAVAVLTYFVAGCSRRKQVLVCILEFSVELLFLCLLVCALRQVAEELQAVRVRLLVEQWHFLKGCLRLTSFEYGFSIGVCL